MDKKLNAKIEKIIKERNAKQDELKQRIEAAKEKITQAETAMEAATNADNETEFIKQADRKRFQEKIIEVCNGKLKANAEAGSGAEYESIAAEIRADIISRIDAAEHKAAGIIAELYKLAMDLDAEIKESNQLAAKWAEASNKKPVEVGYIPTSNEIMRLTMEMQKRKSVAENTVNAAIYANIPRFTI